MPNSIADASPFFLFSGHFAAPLAFPPNHGSPSVSRPRIPAHATLTHREICHRGRTTHRTSKLIRSRRWTARDRSGPTRAAVLSGTRSRPERTLFSARRVVGPIFRKVHRAIQQHLNTGRTVAEMNAHHTVVHFPTVAIPLMTGTHRLVATLSRSRLVHATDSFGVRMVLGHDLLASIS